MASVTRRGDNGRWQVRYRDPAGRQRKRDFDRKVDAERFRAEVEVDKARGAWVDPRKGATKYAEWAERWGRSHASTVRESTWAQNASMLSAHALPAFGSMPLVAITQPDVQAWVDALVARGRAPSTVRKAYQVFGKTMSAAVDAEMIVKTPCRRIQLPAERRVEMRFCTGPEIGKLADAIDPRYRALVQLGAYVGLRIGEMAALRCSRVEVLRRRVRVDATLTEVHGRLVESEPKTKASRRSVSLPRPVAEQLGIHIGGFSEAGPEGIVFPAPDGGPLRLASWRRRFWQPAVRAAGLDGLRVHDLRHTAVALWIAAGANPKEVASRAGHTSVSFTLDRYGHLFEDSDDALTDRLERFWVPSADAHPGA
jgi:integrase